MLLRFYNIDQITQYPCLKENSKPLTVARSVGYVYTSSKCSRAMQLASIANVLSNARNCWAITLFAGLLRMFVICTAFPWICDAFGVDAWIDKFVDSSMMCEFGM